MLSRRGRRGRRAWLWVTVCFLGAAADARSQEDPTGQAKQAPELPGTIAIVAVGPNAGQAVFEALQQVERIASGSIGGVAVIDVMLEDGTICSYQNNGRGGTATLFIEGERTGVPPPPGIAAARIAAIVSTGPRAPADVGQEPCEQEYSTGRNGVGLVVGHRIPDSRGQDGQPVDAQVMQLMNQGVSPAEALDRVLGANPDVDAGLIAVSADGILAVRNAERVERRPDYAHARGEDRTTGALVQTILNEIHPPQAVAQLVVNAALEVMGSFQEPDLQILVQSSLSVEYGHDNLVEVDNELVATRIVTDIAGHVEGEVWAALPYISSPVLQDGRVIGYTINEPLAEVRDGVIQSLSYQPEMMVSVRREPRYCRFASPQLTICDVVGRD